MLNQVVLVGRLVNELEVEEFENVKRAIITLAVRRSWKNADGEYETDLIECTVFGDVAESTSHYCQKGDIIGIKGRIQNTDNKMQIIAEKVTFLSNKKVGEE